MTVQQYQCRLADAGLSCPRGIDWLRGSVQQQKASEKLERDHFSTVRPPSSRQNRRWWFPKEALSQRSLYCASPPVRHGSTLLRFGFSNCAAFSFHFIYQHVCACGRLSDFLGHDRSACATTRVLGRGLAVESAAARICCGSGGPTFW